MWSTIFRSLTTMIFYRIETRWDKASNCWLQNFHLSGPSGWCIKKTPTGSCRAKTIDAHDALTLIVFYIRRKHFWLLHWYQINRWSVSVSLKTFQFFFGCKTDNSCLSKAVLSVSEVFAHQVLHDYTDVNSSKRNQEVSRTHYDKIACAGQSRQKNEC